MIDHEALELASSELHRQVFATSLCRKTYLITGATGDTGSKAVRLLVENGHTVKAFVHKVDRRSAKLAELGAEVVAGDLLDFGAVRTALNRYK